MKQIVSVLLVSMIGFLACKDKKNTVGNEVAEQKATEVVQDPAKDSAEIRTVITDFYNWYNKNYAKLQEYKLYSSIKKKDNPPYKINWDIVEKYQQFIRDSVPHLGEEFVVNQKLFFQQCDSAFKKDVEDDIPYGFDYDWYTNSQEDPQYLLDGINKSVTWIINVKGDRATVEIGAPDDKNYVSSSLLIQLDMKKENDKWRIAKIGND
jgi:hypothetical protein